MKVKLCSLVRPLVTPWTAAFQGPPSMRFSMQSTEMGAIAFSESQPKQNLKPKPNRDNGLFNHVPTFSKSFSFLLPESFLVF